MTCLRAWANHGSLLAGRGARVALTLSAVTLLARPEVVAQARFEMDYPAIARGIVERLALEPGERVLSVKPPGGRFDALVPHLRYEVMRAGGVDLGVVEVLAEPLPLRFDPEVLQAGASAAVEAYRDAFEHVDAAILLPGASPMHPPYAALQSLLLPGTGRRTVHFHWEGAGPSVSATPLPGQPLPAPAVIDAVYQRALLETDYDELGLVQRRFVQAMRRGEVRVTTPLGTDLRFAIGDRPVTVQDGDASRRRAESGVVLIDREIELPAGAIRVAPLEESVNGTIAFPPSQWAGRPVEGLVLRFERGRVTEVSARSGREAVLEEMELAGDASRSFRELALGFNPLLAVPERGPWVPYYGYGAGVVRLSLGDNSELGGAVRGGYVRWNFFVDATVTAGDEAWVRDGRLREP
jgi:hypothetical protein